MASTLDWLRARSDDDLAALLAARPELIVPAPPDLASLARRLDSNGAARRAIASCNALELQLVQALWILGSSGAVGSADGAGSPDTVDSADALNADGNQRPHGDRFRGAAPRRIATFLGGPATSHDVESAARTLEIAGLIHGVADGYVLPDASRRALGQFPAGLGEPGELTATDVAAALSATAGDGMAILQRLVPGPPVGAIEADSPHADTVTALVSAQLLVRKDPRMVVLPREVALALRGDQPLGPARARPPALTPRRHRPGTVNSTAAGQALLARARAIATLRALSADPAAALKTGGIGITALRRLAKSLDFDIAVAALYLELLHGVGLIAPMVLSTGGRVHWAPTRDAESFVEQSDAMAWAHLAVNWLDSRRNAALTGSRDADGNVRNALSAALDWRDGPAERRRILREIAHLPADSGTTNDALTERLLYQRPLSDQGRLHAHVTVVLSEATELGLVAFHGLSAAGVSALQAETEDVADALDAILPEPVDSIMVQGDMTIVAPGHTTRGLATFLDHVAEPESTGNAAVYRVTEGSIRRALDAGFTREHLHELFSEYSSTSVPQSVSYLIDDVARRHGVLRAGSASSFVRSEDPALITQAVVAARKAGIELRAVAPTVAVTLIDLSVLIDTLREAGLTPTAEDTSGAVVDIRARSRHARAADLRQSRFTEPEPPSRQQIATAIGRMRAGDKVPGKASHPTDVLTLLTEAAGVRDQVWIGYAGAEGATTTRLVEPIVVSGGTMVAYDRLRAAPRTFALHRITSAHLADSRT